MAFDMAAIPYGADPGAAPLSAVLIHGRDRTPAEMIGLAGQIDQPQIAWSALQAPRGSWYPGRFMDPLHENQPHLDKALSRVEQAVLALESAGVPRRRVALVGFSQGACLACEFVRRHPARWGALIAFTGGLFGPEGSDWDAHTSLDGTPTLITNSDQDDWVPWSRTDETAAALRRMGADVTLKLYPGRHHIVGDDEIVEARAILRRALADAEALPILEDKS
jgi:phospholipase/carboxylesterase